MKNLPVQERALRKRSALISAAIREFSTVGFEVATAKSIAAAAAVATGTFYQYFENKNDILRVIAQERFAQLHQRIPPLNLHTADQGSHTGIIGLFSSTLRFVYEFHAREPELHQVLDQRRALDPALRKIMDDGEVVLRERVRALVRTLDCENSLIVADNLFSMAEGLIHRHVFDNQKHDTDAVIQVGAEMLASYFVTVKTDSKEY